LPVPLDPLVIVSQDAWLEAFHEQPGPEVTNAVPDVASSPTATSVGEML
jgi:hypothetical protein